MLFSVIKKTEHDETHYLADCELKFLYKVIEDSTGLFKRKSLKVEPLTSKIYLLGKEDKNLSDLVEEIEDYNKQQIALYAQKEGY